VRARFDDVDVECEVALCPIEVRPRHVDRGGRRRAARGRMYGCRSRVSEEIQETPPGGGFAQARPRDAVIEKEAGVEVIVEVDEQPHAALEHRMEFVVLAELAILVAAMHAA